MQAGIRSVRRRRLYEDIVQQFHSLIRQGVLQHGARLPSERLLAAQFKVSRSSVREAIRSLELQGLVVSKRGSGTFINTDDLDSVVALIATTLSSGGETLRDIFEVRHLLEPQIAAVAAQRAGEEEVRRSSSEKASIWPLDSGLRNSPLSWTPPNPAVWTWALRTSWV